MDILIKSFNRPYYLDRCLQSIYFNCAASDFKIKVLDDGTPQKYLDKLQIKFPDISIQKSEFYYLKSEKCDLGLKPVTMEIPISLWITSVQKASEYFVLLEDDFWFTSKINLNKINEQAMIHNLAMLKLFWLSNSKFIQSNKNQKKELFTIYEPNIYTKNRLLYALGFHRFNKLKFREIFRFLGIFSEERFLAYYSIYAVAGVVFNKKYFLSLWKNNKNTIDEGLQIANAVAYISQNKSVFAHTNLEIVKTGFMSSATNQFKEEYSSKVDMFQFNKMINEAWFKEKLDVMSSFPNDISEVAISEVLEASNSVIISSDDWKNWVENFRNQYIKMGCNIDY